MNYPTEVRIPDAPADEIGTPSAMLMRCETHDVLHRRFGRCLDCVRGAQR